MTLLKESKYGISKKMEWFTKIIMLYWSASPKFLKHFRSCNFKCLAIHMAFLLSVSIFISRAYLENRWGYFLYIAHTHNMWFVNHFFLEYKTIEVDTR